MSLSRVVSFFERFDFPRVSGDEPGAIAVIKPIREFSPRERG